MGLNTGCKSDTFFFIFYPGIRDILLISQSYFSSSLTLAERSHFRSLGRSRERFHVNVPISTPRLDGVDGTSKRKAYNQNGVQRRQPSTENEVRQNFRLTVDIFHALVHNMSDRILIKNKLVNNKRISTLNNTHSCD